MTQHKDCSGVARFPQRKTRPVDLKMVRLVMEMAVQEDATAFGKLASKVMAKHL